MIDTFRFPQVNDVWTYQGPTEGARFYPPPGAGSIYNVVRNFGALANGFDQTAAFQNAEDTCAAIGGCTIIVPEGTFTINDAITLSGKNNWIIGYDAELIGEGRFGTTALLDTGPVIWQGGGQGTNRDIHRFDWWNGRVDIFNGNMSLQSTDPCVTTFLTLSGTPTAGESPGISWKIGATTYTARYTIQAGDDMEDVLRGLANAMGPAPAAHATVTPTGSTIIGALHALNPRCQLQAGSSVNGALPGVSVANSWLAFDRPFGLADAPTGISTANITATVTGDHLDVSPLFTILRHVPGWTPAQDDAIGEIKFVSQSSPTSGANNVSAIINVRMEDPSDPNNPVASMQLGTSTADSAHQSTVHITMDKGVSGTKGDGSRTALPRLGQGKWYLGDLSIDPDGGTLGVKDAYPHPAMVSFAGTYDEQPAIFQLTTINENTSTNTHYGFLHNPTFHPQGASLSKINAIANLPTIDDNALNIAEYVGFRSFLQTEADYTGQITSAIDFAIDVGGLAGTKTPTNRIGLLINAFTNGHNVASVNIANSGTKIVGGSANAGAGSTISNSAIEVIPGSGTTAGTTNAAIYIHGNGGGSSATDFAIRSTSTARSLLSGELQLTSTFRMSTSQTPAAAAAAGSTGQIAWDASYFYVCIATNTWHRAAHATW